MNSQNLNQQVWERVGMQHAEFFPNVSMRHCLQTESALPSSWNAVISVSDYMGTLKQYCEMNLFWFEMRAEFFQGNAGSLQTL